MVPVCRCCNCNFLEANHRLYSYGKKASNESLLNFLEKLLGYKCDVADGLSSKMCRLSYEEIIKFKKFIEMFDKSTVNQQAVYVSSLARVKQILLQGNHQPRVIKERRRLLIIITLSIIPTKWLRLQDRGFSYLDQYCPQQKFIGLRRMR